MTGAIEGRATVAHEHRQPHSTPRQALEDLATSCESGKRERLGSRQSWTHAHAKERMKWRDELPSDELQLRACWKGKRQVRRIGDLRIAAQAVPLHRLTTLHSRSMGMAPPDSEFRVAARCARERMPTHRHSR